VQKSLAAVSVLFSVIITTSYFTGSCRKDTKPLTPQTMQQVIPVGFPAPVYQFRDNPLSEQGFQLGRKLFYDGRLSLDGGFPCASCHQQIAGFGTFEHDRSHGYNHSHTLRNAPVLFNLAWQKELHWDGAFKSLYEEAQQPITGHIEMAESFPGIIAKLETDGTYPAMFRNTFGDEAITQDRILKALVQFTGYMTSANSKYDRVKKGIESFTEEQERGYQLFKTNCASCHTEPMFTDYNFYNIGLPVSTDLNDFGKMLVTNDPQDSLKFKVPTLRNVNISSNYMHDGRFNTLLQCVQHYVSGVQVGPTLDPRLASGIALNDDQQSDVVAFLRTLTDSTFITDPRYSKPQ
jgi:cytochrome c peroxidase